MANKKIKVPGYSKKVIYNGDIEYRPYSDNLVGNQFASDGGTSLFTVGNFEITTNVDPKLSKTYTKGGLSDFYTLSNMKLTEVEIKEFRKRVSKLNSDPTKLKNYAYFGSLTELVKTTITDIKNKWPASLYAYPIYGSLSGYTFENYTYDLTTNKSNFKVSTNFINNDYDINYKNVSTTGRTLYNNFKKYVVDVSDTEYKVIGFTGSTKDTNDYFYIQIEGNPFSITDGYIKYHIKPNSLERSKFFNGLNDISSALLNRGNNSLYTINVNYQKETENGVIIDSTKKIKWPLSDNYNLAVIGSDYTSYYNEITTIADDHDSVQGNIINRQFVTNAINDFDKLPTTSGGAIENDTDRIKELLNIYGRGFDESKKPIDGLSFQRNITYDKKDNPSDNLIRYILNNIGWKKTSSGEIGDLYQDANPTNIIYSGQSKGYSKNEVDIEFWRRLMINTAWMWKSKGTRKGVEFLFKLLGVPNSLIKINEHIYVAEDKLDVSVVDKTLLNISASTSSDLLPIDGAGYPSPLPETNSNYYQSFGKWWRTTGGLTPTVDELDGNNPHSGGYDGGSAYINSFKNFIPNFEPVTFTEQVLKETTENLFLNYNKGKINGVNQIGCALPTQTYLDKLVGDTIKTAENERALTGDNTTVSTSVGYGPCTATTVWNVKFYKNNILNNTQLLHTGYKHFTSGAISNTTTAATSTVTTVLKTGFEAIGVTFESDDDTMVITSSGCTATDKFKYELCINTTINCG